MFGHCPDEPDYYWDHEEDWRNTLKEEAERTSKHAELKEDETTDTKHFKPERDIASEIEDLELRLKGLKQPRAIERAKEQLATLREIKATEQKRPPRYER